MHPFPHHYVVSALARPLGDVPLSAEGMRVIESAPPKEFDGPWQSVVAGGIADSGGGRLYGTGISRHRDGVQVRVDQPGNPYAGHLGPRRRKNALHAFRDAGQIAGAAGCGHRARQEAIGKSGGQLLGGEFFEQRTSLEVGSDHRLKVATGPPRPRLKVGVVRDPVDSCAKRMTELAKRVTDLRRDAHD